MLPRERGGGMNGVQKSSLSVYQGWITFLNLVVFPASKGSCTPLSSLLQYIKRIVKAFNHPCLQKGPIAHIIKCPARIITSSLRCQKRIKQRVSCKNRYKGKEFEKLAMSLIM
ncbi:hypothetical protein CEXT_28411 [Caerostris extrusa]|uniref:Uncharacterized protein n=1 Tax=Caerostris extrusa TaxID=172846 RepID=A0AAV4TH51_CAEEX|nr:hypothetical protein CEXT_28411 [Caerostris extrusa]